MRSAAQSLLERHANLRAGFRQTSSGEWVQVVPADAELPWRDVDLTGLEADDQRAAADLAATEDRERRFDLTRPPLLRVTVVRLGEDRVRLVMTNHHILLDGWSMPILWQELTTLYAAEGSADGAGLPRVRPYRDYLSWLDARDRGAAEDAWTDSLTGLDGATLIAPEADAGQCRSAAHSVRAGPRHHRGALAVGEEPRGDDEHGGAGRVGACPGPGHRAR